jgi:hypothetical protein
MAMTNNGAKILRCTYAVASVLAAMIFAAFSTQPVAAEPKPSPRAVGPAAAAAPASPGGSPALAPATTTFKSDLLIRLPSSGAPRTTFVEPAQPGRFVALFVDKTITLLDLATGEAVHQVDAAVATPDPMHRTVLSPDGRFIASTDVWATRAQGLDDAEAFTKFDAKGVIDFIDDQQALILSDTGARSPLQIIDFRTGKATKAVELDVKGGDLTLSPDRHTLAFIKRGTINLASVPAGGMTRTLKRAAGDCSGLLHLAWSPDGKRLAAIGLDRPNCWLVVWDTASGKVLVEAAPKFEGSQLLYSPEARQLRFFPGGKRILYQGTILDAQTGVIVKSYALKGFDAPSAVSPLGPEHLLTVWLPKGREKQITIAAAKVGDELRRPGAPAAAPQKGGDGLD